MMHLLTICISAMLVNNVILSQFMGICPFLGVSGKLSQAKGMSIAVGSVILASVIIIYPVRLLLNKLNLTYLETIMYIVIIAALVSIAEMVIRKYNKRLYDSLGVYLPLITTNCAVLGTAIRSSWQGYNIIESITYALGVSIGFAMAIIIMAGIRARIDDNEVPESFRGMPIVLVTAGLMAIAFSCFAGIGG